MSKVTRLILTEDQSSVLSDAGDCFLVAIRGSYPDAVNRFVVHALPAERTKIEEAIEVIRGTRRTVKKKPKESP